jgi:phenylacetate-CoA ligase
VRRQPFVWVFGRSFWAVSLYGCNVYVEQIMPALEGGEEEGGGGGGAEDTAAAGGAAAAVGGKAEGWRPLADLLTGKFVLYIAEDEDANPRVALRVELAPGAAPSAALAARVAAAVRAALLRRSSEYGAYVPAERQLPLVTLHDAGDPEWFPVGVKHRYTLGT